MATLKRSRRKTIRPGNHRNAFVHFSADIMQYELDTGVVDCLVSWCVLTIEDADKIRRTSGQTNCNKLLLNILKKRPYNTFNIFIKALETTDPIFTDLVNEMKAFEVEDEQPIVKSADESIEIDDLCVRFQKSYKTLVDQITSPIKIVEILLELEAFNREDYEDISSLSTVYQKNRKLLSKVEYKGRSGYEKFMRALKTSDDSRDQELATEVENMEISQDDKSLLHIGTTLSHENENIPSNVREIAQQFEECWIEEDGVFVETKGTKKVFEAIIDSNFITIVGSSGSGKTAVMRHVVLTLKLTEGFQVIPIDSPDKIIEYRDDDIKQIFLIDDVLGKYKVSPMLVEIWERFDTKIQHCLNKNPGNMKLLFTLRRQVVNDKKFSNCSSFITNNIVDLEDNEIALSTEEKKQILTKHLKLRDMEGSVTENDVEEACACDYAFPLLCKIVSSNNERLTNIAKIFREPFSVLEEELRKLCTKNKKVYCALVFCMLLNGVGQDFFDVNLQQHEKFSIVAEACGLDTNISRKVIEDSLTTVVGTYVRCENGFFHFMHDAFHECISSNFAHLNPKVMFSCCDISLIRDRVRINYKLDDDDENVMVISKNQFEVITERILTECEEGRFSNVTLSHLITNGAFVEYFGRTISSKHHTTINTLMRKVSVERHVSKRTISHFLKSFLGLVNACYVILIRKCSCCKKSTSKKIDDKNNNKLDINNAAIKHVIRAPSRQSTLLHWILASGCTSFFRYFSEKASEKKMKKILSRDWNYPLTKPLFPLAVLGGNVDIIQTLHCSGADVNCFSYEGETPLSITAKSGRDDIAGLLIGWGADVNKADMFSHRFPSFICVENDAVEVLKLLLTKNCDVNLVDIYGTTSTMLQALLTRKRDIINVLLKFDSKAHPLHAAILHHDVECLKTNLKNEDINSKTSNGLTPLHYATQVNGTIMITTLLGNRAINFTDDKETIDQLMVGRSSQERIPLMVADINSANKNGLTPLHLAVLNDHVEAVKLLMQSHADVNAKDHFGRIPLHYAQSPAISILLLNLEISRYEVKYSSKSCSVVLVKQPDVVVVIDGDQGENRQTITLCTLIRNVASCMLPFKSCSNRAIINQLDNHGNTPLHVVVETSRDLHPNIKKKCDIAGNIKLLKKHGANTNRRNDEGYFPSDFVHNNKKLHKLLTSDAIRKSRDDYIFKQFVLLGFYIILSYILVLSPVYSTLFRTHNEATILKDASNSNNTNIDALKRLEQINYDWFMQYFFFIGIAFVIMTNIAIIRVVIQLWKTNRRYRFVCIIFIPVMHCSAVTLFVVYVFYDKTFSFNRFLHVIFVSIFNSFNVGFAIRIKELLLFKIKHLQNMFVFQVCVNIVLSISTIMTFVLAPLNEEPMSTSNNTIGLCSGDVLNGSHINQATDVINTTTFQTSTSVNCTENTLSVPEQDFTPFCCTLLYTIVISMGLVIFPLLRRQNSKKVNKISFRYISHISQMLLWYLVIVLIIVILIIAGIYGTILKAIKNSLLHT